MKNVSFFSVMTQKMPKQKNEDKPGWGGAIVIKENAIVAGPIFNFQFHSLLPDETRKLDKQQTIAGGRPTWGIR